MSIVPHAANGMDADLGERHPDEGWDFLDGDGMVLVFGNHCLIMPSGLHPKSLERYLRQFLKVCHENEGVDILDKSDRFDLLPVADSEVTKQIQNEGVKRISLNVGQYLETTNTQRE